MNFKTPPLLGHTPPILEVPAHQVWHRVQRKTARKDSVRHKDYVLAQPGGLAGRFDLADEATAYLADGPETALYESLFRREVRSCHFSRIEQRALLTFETQAPLRLVRAESAADLRDPGPVAAGGLARAGDALPCVAVHAL